jgi:hypothetical protein
MGSDFCFWRIGQFVFRTASSVERDWVVSYDEELVRHLLVLLGHGVRSGLGEETDGAEESEADTETDGNTPSDASAGTRGVLGAGAVRTESDPVSCK